MKNSGSGPSAPKGALKGSIHTTKRALATKPIKSAKSNLRLKQAQKPKHNLLKTAKRRMAISRPTPLSSSTPQSEGGTDDVSSDGSELEVVDPRGFRASQRERNERNKALNDVYDERLVQAGIISESQDPNYQFQKQYNGGDGLKLKRLSTETLDSINPDQFPIHNRNHFVPLVDELPDPDLSEGEKPWDLPETKIREPHAYENIKPFIVERTKRRPHDPQDSTAPGARAHTTYYEKFRHDPNYNIMKEVTGYNSWYETDAVLTPQNGILRDFFTKQYMRDPKTNLATMPSRFKTSIKYDELQKVLQKADHYFFEDRPAPVAQLLVPLRDPRTILPDSPISTMVTNLEKKHQVGLPYALDKNQRAKIEKALKEVELPRLRNEADIMGYMQGQVDKMYETVQNNDAEYLSYLNSVDQRQPNLSLVSGQHWTAQMRRAEFWRKYLELFNFVDLLHTTTVRCTRAVGRVDSAAALVVMGNGHGIFTYGRGKASVREQAVRIALLKTRRNVLFTPLHENRTPYYSIIGKFKASTIVLAPQPRGVGLRAGRLTFTLLETLGYKDASAKLRGRPNIWNIVRAWMECLKYQESYREIANMRGQHYQQMMNPWTKTPPTPSREEIQELEDVAAQAFKEAVVDIFRSRQLYETDTFKEITPHFTERANWVQKWDRYLDMANVPQSVRLYPGFSEYLDATKLLQEKKFRDEIHSDLEDIWSPTETEENENPLHGTNNTGEGTTLYSGGRSNPQRYRTSRDDQPYYQYYKGVEQPKFNRKAMRFTAFNQHIQELATTSMQRAVGVEPLNDPHALESAFAFPTDIARNEKRQASQQQ